MNVTAYHMWSPTCGPCKVIKPAIEDLKQEFPEINWVSVNTHEDNVGYAERFGVKFVPTIVVVVSDSTGKLLFSQKQSGTDMAGYYRLIRSALRYLTN
jgi:thiol-disulfide isomerase/thioredoxin